MAKDDDNLSIISTVIHVLLEWLSFPSGIRSIIFPQVPKFASLVMTVINGTSFENVGIKAHQTLFSEETVNILDQNQTQLIYVLAFFFVYYHRKYIVDILKTLYAYARKKFRFKKFEERTHVSMVTVKDPITVISMIRFFMANTRNKEVMQKVKLSKLEYIACGSFSSRAKFSISKNGLRDFLSPETMYEGYGKETITVPVDMTFDLMLDKERFGCDSVTITMNTSYKMKSKSEEKQSDVKSDTVKEQEALLLKMEKDSMVEIEEITIEFSIFYKGNTLNLADVAMYIHDIVGAYVKEQHIENDNKDRFDLINKVDEKLSVTMNLSFGPIIPREKRLEMYLEKYTHQVGDDLRKLVYSFLNDCDTSKRTIMSAYVPYLSLLFHGPPGSGKTVIANMLALALNRQVCIVKLTEHYYINGLYKFISEYASRNNIILFDEIDKAIELVKKDNEAAELINGTSQSIVEASLQKCDFEKNPELINMFPHRYNYIMSGKRYCEVYDWKPEALLQVFDGTYAQTGAIILGTTNNPEILMDIGTGKTKGALVRDGRLKLFRIGYFDRPTAYKFLTEKFGPNHGIVLKDEWFDENNEFKIPNSNFVNLVKAATEPEDIIPKIEDSIKIMEQIEVYRQEELKQKMKSDTKCSDVECQTDAMDD